MHAPFTGVIPTYNHQHLGKQAFCLFSGLINSMATDCLSQVLVLLAPSLKKVAEYETGKTKIKK